MERPRYNFAARPIVPVLVSDNNQTVLKPMRWGLIPPMGRRVWQIRLAMYNLEKLATHPTLWGRTHEER